MKIITTAIAKQNIIVGDLVVIYVGWDGANIYSAAIERNPEKEIGFVEAKMADPDLVAGIEAYRAGKLSKKDA